MHYINSDKAKIYNHCPYTQIIIKILFTCCTLRHFYKKYFLANIYKKKLFTYCALRHFYKKKFSCKYKKNFIHLLRFETLL